MYFKQLSLDTLNESNQWNMLSESDFSSIGRDIMRDPNNPFGNTNEFAQKINNLSMKNPINLNNVPDWMKKMYERYIENSQRTSSDITDTGNIFSWKNSDMEPFKPLPLWQQFTSFLSKTYEGVKNQGEQFVNNHQQGIDRTGGFIAGFLSKMGVDAIKNWIFPPEVQEVVKEPEKMSALAGAGIGAAVTAGVLGLIWLFKKWQKKGQVTDQDIQYAAKLNQMKPEDIPEEDKNKPVEA